MRSLAAPGKMGGGGRGRMERRGRRGRSAEDAGWGGGKLATSDISTFFFTDFFLEMAGFSSAAALSISAI